MTTILHYPASIPHGYEGQGKMHRKGENTPRAAKRLPSTRDPKPASTLVRGASAREIEAS